MKCDLTPKLLVILLLFFFGNVAFSQEKIEKEYRIDEQQVPTAAAEAIAGFNFKNKIKWYRERNIDAATIEAKTKSRYGQMSIEFTEEGAFIDLEIRCSENSIPKVVRKKINQYFNKNYKRWGFRKIQKQYTGSLENIRREIANKSNKDQSLKGYEIVAKGKEEDEMKLYEFFFSKDGTFIKRTRIILKPIDNLQF